MRALVATSLWFDNAAVVARALEDLREEAAVGEVVEVVLGEGVGASLVAWNLIAATASPDLVAEVHPRDWEAHVRAARAQHIEMVDSGADVCLVFYTWNGQGHADAYHLVDLSTAAGIPLRVFWDW